MYGCEKTEVEKMLPYGPGNRRTQKELIRIHWKVGWPVWKLHLKLGRDLISLTLTA